MTTLAVLSPIDPGTNTRVTVEVCSSQDGTATGADDQIWWPAITTQPVLSMSFFDGDFTSAVEPAAASMTIRLDVLRNSRQFPRAARYDWSGAAVTIYRMVAGAPVLLAEMRVDRFASEDDALSLSMSVDPQPFEADVLFNTYAGTTGAEGGADLKGQPKPWAFGRCINVEPVFIDQIDNVFQVSGYGPVSAIPAVYERGASFGDSIGDFADYAALIAAVIPEGRWGTCIAEGMFRLGAPPAGVITCDVDGDTGGGFLRRTGAIISEIADRLSLTAKINAASLAALDAAVARDVNIHISQQANLLDLARAMAAPCNAVAGIALDGRLIMPRVAFGAEQFVLDAQGREMPPVLGMGRQNTSAPYAEIRMGAAQSYRVHTFDEIAFFADLIDRGLYDAAATYREGNLVESVDKSRWVYVNPTPSSGNAPPTWPTTSNAFWSNIAPPISSEFIGDIVAPGNSNRVPFSRMEGDRGWALLSNPVPLVAPVDYSEAFGLRYFRASAVATAAGQSISIGQFGPAFTVRPGERLSVQARVELSGTAGDGGTWQLELWTFEADGVTQSATVVASGVGPNSISTNIVRGFVDVPAGRVFGRLELRATSAGAGTMPLLISEPMVTSAATLQTEHAPYTAGPNSDDAADVTALAQRSIVPEFPVIEIKQGEAGNVGNRTVSHTAKRGTATLTGGTWSLPSQNLGASPPYATINPSSGTVTLSGILISGAYIVRYTHTDGIATDLPVNVTYVPTPPTAVVQAKTGRVQSSLGTINNNDWQTIATLTITGAPAGRVNFEGDSFVEPLTGTGTADFEARLRLDGATTIASIGSQSVVDAGSILPTDFSALFTGIRADVAAGTRAITIELRRTSGSGVIGTTSTGLEASIIAT